ncbi:MAG: ribosome recycling factor [Cytophagaceae bacterium]|nr:ribosome recycling factor [Cytophagaceae bacterium]MDW8456694.1 ribosome recycling factor [Cytophagaceae bacterium]
MEEIALYLDEAKESMAKALKHLEQELMKIRAGKAVPAMLDGIQVEYYGTMSSLQNVSSITATDARTLTIKPYEKSMIPVIEKAIRDANLGFNPQNNGEIVIVSIPPMTEERRKALVKQAKSEGENGKVRIRTIRKEINDELKKMLKDGAPEDSIKDAEQKVQAITDDFISQIDQLLARKESEIMTI